MQKVKMALAAVLLIVPCAFEVKAADKLETTAAVHLVNTCQQERQSLEHVQHFVAQGLRFPALRHILISRYERLKECQKRQTAKS